MSRQTERRGPRHHPHVPHRYQTDPTGYPMPWISSLQGLVGVGLIVGERGADIDTEEEGFSAPGIPSAHVRQVLETALRDQGMPPLSPEQCMSAPGEPNLSVWIDWEVGQAGGRVRADFQVDEGESLLGAVDQALVTVVDRFCQDHRHVNQGPAQSVTGV